MSAPDDNGAMPQPETIIANMPVIELSGVTMRVVRSPQHPGMTFLHFGPVILQVALDADNKRAIVSGLTGVEIARRMDVPKG